MDGRPRGGRRRSLGGGGVTPWAGLLGAFIYGVLGFGAAYAFGYWGLQRVPAGLAAVILASTPLFTFALAVLHRQEQFRWQPLLGGAIALGGILVMFSRSASAAVPLSSLLAMIATAICAAEASIVIKQFPKSHPITTNAIAMATGAVILFALSVAFREPLLRPNQVTTRLAPRSDQRVPKAPSDYDNRSRQGLWGRHPLRPLLRLPGAAASTQPGHHVDRA